MTSWLSKGTISPYLYILEISLLKFDAVYFGKYVATFLRNPMNPILKVGDSGSTLLQYVLPTYQTTRCYTQENCILIATAVRTAALMCATYQLQNRKVRVQISARRFVISAVGRCCV
jgi:hypothetical protein